MLHYRVNVKTLILKRPCRNVLGLGPYFLKKTPGEGPSAHFCIDREPFRVLRLVNWFTSLEEEEVMDLDTSVIGLDLVRWCVLKRLVIRTMKASCVTLLKAV